MVTLIKESRVYQGYFMAGRFERYRPVYLWGRMYLMSMMYSLQHDRPITSKDLASLHTSLISSLHKRGSLQVSKKQTCSCTVMVIQSNSRYCLLVIDVGKADVFQAQTLQS
jgi:hypothetical protein